MDDHAIGAAPPAAAEVFGRWLHLAEAYVQLLATTGVERGLIGPREVPRLWDRHLLNCAAALELVPSGSSVLDVGSGAGLPGLVFALARTDLDIVLLDPMERRVAFLDEAVATLGLDRVRVVRGRAEDQAGVLTAQVVTSRAVAPLDRLARWCLPLTEPGGAVLAIKGAAAEAEVQEHSAAVRRAGGDAPEVLRCGAGLVEPLTTVVRIGRPAARPGARSGAQSGARSGARSGGRVASRPRPRRGSAGR